MSDAVRTARVLLMPLPVYPVTCGRPDCGHVLCNRIRRQVGLPCADCGQAIGPGEKFVERVADHVTVTTQAHAICRGTTP